MILLLQDYGDLYTSYSAVFSPHALSASQMNYLSEAGLLEAADWYIPDDSGITPDLRLRLDSRLYLHYETIEDGSIELRELYSIKGTPLNS